MPRRQHVVTLATAQRTELRDRLHRGTTPARTQTRARILLLADTGVGGARWHDAHIAEAVDASARTVARVRAAWTDQGMGCLDRRPSANPATPKLSSADEARLVAIAGGPPPSGHAQWSLRLLAGRVVELGVTDALSYETVRRTLKKTSSSRG